MGTRGSIRRRAPAPLWHRLAVGVLFVGLFAGLSAGSAWWAQLAVAGVYAALADLLLLGVGALYGRTERRIPAVLRSRGTRRPSGGRRRRVETINSPRAGS